MTQTWAAEPTNRSTPQEPGPNASLHEREDWAQYLKDLEDHRLMREDDPQPWWLR